MKTNSLFPLKVTTTIKNLIIDLRKKNKKEKERVQLPIIDRDFS